MPEYGIPLTIVIPYKDRDKDFVIMQENTGQRKPVFWHILHNLKISTKNKIEKLSQYESKQNSICFTEAFHGDLKTLLMFV